MLRARVNNLVWLAMSVVDVSFVATESSLSAVYVATATLHVSRQQHGNLVAQEKVI